MKGKCAFAGVGIFKWTVKRRKDLDITGDYNQIYEIRVTELTAAGDLVPNAWSLFDTLTYRGGMYESNFSSHQFSTQKNMAQYIVEHIVPSVREKEDD